MVVSDEFLSIVFLWLVNYLVISRRNLFIGNMIGMLIGFGLIYIFLGTLYMWVGVVMSLIGAVSMIFDLTGGWNK